MDGNILKHGSSVKEPKIGSLILREDFDRTLKQLKDHRNTGPGCIFRKVLMSLGLKQEIGCLV